MVRLRAPPSRTRERSWHGSFQLDLSDFLPTACRPSVHIRVIRPVNRLPRRDRRSRIALGIRGAAHVVIAWMVIAIATAIPKINASLSGYGAMSSLLAPDRYCCADPREGPGGIP